MTLDMLAAWIAQHGCDVRVTSHGVEIGLVWSRRNTDGSVTLGTEWSRPVSTLVAAARELGY